MQGGEPAESLRVEEEESAPQRTSDPHSLTDDVIALLDDGKTYVQAEIAFQKTRAAFTLEKGKWGAAYLAGALALLHLALVALVVGLLIALSPLLTPWGATAVVVGLLAIGAVVLVKMAKSKFGRLADAYRETRP